MSGFLNSISNAFDATANSIRDGILSEQEQKDRSDLRKILEVIKVAAVVSAVVSVLFTAVVPSLFSICITILDIFIVKEIVVVSQNICEILDNAVVEVRARSTKESLIDQICKNTFIPRPIFRIVDPNLNKFISINA